MEDSIVTKSSLLIGKRASSAMRTTWRPEVAEYPWASDAFERVMAFRAPELKASPPATRMDLGAISRSIRVRVLSRRRLIGVQFSHSHFLTPLSSSMLSPPNVFAPKVSDTQSDATNDNGEQDIIYTHIHSSLATHNSGS